MSIDSSSLRNTNDMKTDLDIQFTTLLFNITLYLCMFQKGEKSDTKRLLIIVLFRP
jgi:hypothetical protein